MILRSLSVFILAAALIACNQDEQKSVKMENAQDSASYALGFNVGRNIKSQITDINDDVFLKGLNQAVKGDSSLLSDEQIAMQINNFQQQLADKKESEAKAAGEKNIKDGQNFLDENKSKEGVVSTASGLQYKILKSGSGPKPKKTDKVTVQYVGKLIDGTEFDSSIKRGQPATFGVDQVIPGWTEALQLMPVGSKWELYIPSELAYGSQQRSELITPNSVLVFEVELLNIETEK